MERNPRLCSLADGGSNVDLNSLRDISALLKPCRLAAASVQLRLVLGQIGRNLTRESTRQTANSSIDKLSFTLFDQPMSSEEACFIAELAKDVDNQVASKVLYHYYLDRRLGFMVPQFIQNGLQRIIEIIQDASLTSEHDVSMGWVHHVGQILRILAHFAEPLRREPSLLPQLEPEVQDKFIGILCTKFKALESMLHNDPSAQVADLSIFLARLLQFDLGFIRTWTAKTKETGLTLLTNLFRLALVGLIYCPNCAKLMGSYSATVLGTIWISSHFL